MRGTTKDSVIYLQSCLILVQTPVKAKRKKDRLSNSYSLWREFVQQSQDKESGLAAYSLVLLQGFQYL